ncbi:MAG: glycosyltransferase family 4 protein [Planctomycetota bacterium]
MALDLALGLFRVTPFGGLERQALELARAALARGHRVRLYTRRFQGERPHGLEVHELPVRALTNLGRDQAFDRAFARALAARPAAVVVGFNRLSGLDVFYAADPCHAATRGRPGRLPLPARRARNALERALFAPEASTHALVQSERELERYRAHYATPPERLHLLPPGLRAEFLGSGARDDELRRSLGIAPDVRVVLAVGSDFHRKGLDRTIEALARVRAPRVLLLVVGEGRATAYRRRARARGVAAHFAGGRSDILACYRVAELLVHPAREENTGTVLLEAASQGVPVIASGTCGFAPLLARAGAGIALAEPFRAKDLAEALARLLGDEDLRRELGARGRAAAPGWSATQRLARMLAVIEAAARARVEAAR